MKVKIRGATPMERLTNFTQQVLAVSKTEVIEEERKWKKARSARPKKAHKQNR